MNVASRVLVRPSWFLLIQGRSWTISLQMLGAILLMLAMLSSALAVIYVKALERNLYSELQSSRQQYDKLKVVWSQLLLEENTWAAPVRIQALAQRELGMIIPGAEDTVLLTKPA